MSYINLEFNSKFRKIPNLEFLPTPHNMYNRNSEKIHFFDKKNLKKRFFIKALLI